MNFVVWLQKCEYSNGKFLGAKSCCSQGILLELLLPPYFHSDITHSDHILCHRDERISSATSRWLFLYLFPFCANVLTSYHNGSKKPSIYNLIRLDAGSFVQMNQRCSKTYSFFTISCKICCKNHFYLFLYLFKILPK